MGPKRTLESVGSHLSSAPKLPKLEHAITAPTFPTTQNASPNDFSRSVKKKLQSSSRTGQACDRCKIRKIRCDAKPGGCSPCEQNNTECTTTDRITGVPIRRGHVEELEAELALVRSHNADLVSQLRELGFEPRGIASFNNAYQNNHTWPTSNASQLGSDWTHGQQRRSSGSPVSYAPASGVESVDYGPPRSKRSSIGNNYVGVSSEDTLLSHIKGTSLSIFGTKLDITDFVEEKGVDYDSSELSYSHILRVIFREDQDVEHVPYPDYNTLHSYAAWYILSLNPYTMLLDKPTFMKLIWRIGNDTTFKPSPAETVCVHMMLATLKYQIAARNGEDHIMEESHKHYRYALTFFKDLLHGHTLQDVQGLAMICQHVRNFPKPGAAWMVTNTAFSLAVELAFHRSIRASAEASKMDKLEIELRKRIFWALHGLMVNLSGKLGRPMPIAMEDTDVEFPEPVNDCLPEEEVPRNPFHRCSFQIGIQAAKCSALSSQLYRSIYAVKHSPRGYEEAVRNLEQKIQQWRADMPAELRDPARAGPNDRIFALYAEFWAVEFQFLLHHPAVCRTTNPALIDSGLDKVLAASQKMLENCTRISQLRSIDIPWINTVVYIGAIFTTLFIHYQRRDVMTMTDINKLRLDMDKWVDIIGQCGQLLRTGDKLKNAVRQIVISWLDNINQSIVKRTATESLARVDVHNTSTQSSETAYSGADAYQQYSDPNPQPAEYAALGTSTSPFTSIPAGTSLTYAPLVPSAEQPSMSFDHQGYEASVDSGMPASHAAALVAAAAPNASAQRMNGSYSYPNGHANPTAYQPPYNATIGRHWQQWSQATAATVQRTPSNYLNSADTLQPLSSRESSDQSAGSNGVGGVGVVERPGVPATGEPAFQYTVEKWPGIVFPNAVANSVALGLGDQPT